LQNEELYRMSVLGNTPTLANQEFARIEVSCTNLGATGNDGTIDFWASVNGTISEVFRMNGADNENNSFRPLDMNGQDIKTSSGSMVISTTSSTGTGNITINAKANISSTSVNTSMTATGNLVLTGTNDVTISSTQGCAVQSVLGAGPVGAVYTNPGSVELQADTELKLTGALTSATAGGASGFLQITINGTPYKIALLTP
jgi:hypothetical protein